MSSALMLVPRPRVVLTAALMAGWGLAGCGRAEVVGLFLPVAHLPSRPEDSDLALQHHTEPALHLGADPLDQLGDVARARFPCCG